MSVNQPAPFLRSRRNIWLLAIVLLIISLLAVALIMNQFQTGSHTVSGASDTGPQSFSVGSGALLIIKEQGGNISVSPSHTQTITITPRKSGTTLAPDPHAVNLLYNRVLTSSGHDQITVSTDPWTSNTDFVITIPDTTATQVLVNSGSIDIHAGNGANLSTSSGSIDLDTIHGPVNAHTDSGDITASAITGSVTLSASSGSIRMLQINGQINAQTWSGDVTARSINLSGNSLLQTQNGSVRFAGSLDPKGSYKMQTTSGDVDLTLPGNAAFLLNASTGSGNINNAFGSDATGTTPRAALLLHTQNGSIAVVKAS